MNLGISIQIPAGVAGPGVAGAPPPPTPMTNTVSANLATWNGTPVETNEVASNLAEWN